MAAKMQQLNGIKLTEKQLSEMEYNQQRMASLDNDINAMVDEWKKTQDAPKEAAKKLKEAAKKLKEDAEFVNKSIRDIEKQYHAIGNTSQEVDRMNLAVKGATTEQLNYVKSLQDVISANEAYTKVMERLKGLDYRVETLGMTARQKEMYDLEKAGATREQLAYADRQLRTIEQFEESNKRFEESTKTMKNAADTTFEALTGEKKEKKPIEQMSYYGPRESNEEYLNRLRTPSGSSGKLPTTVPPKNLPSKAAQGNTQQNQNKEAITLKIMTADGKEIIGDFFSSKDGVKFFKDVLGTVVNEEARRLRG